jgi:hypothetical protein
MLTAVAAPRHHFSPDTKGASFMGEDDPLSPGQARVLWLMTADPETWDLAEAPSWLARECAEAGLVFEVAPGHWRRTVKGNREIQRRLGEAI